MALRNNAEIWRDGYGHTLEHWPLDTGNRPPRLRPSRADFLALAKKLTDEAIRNPEASWVLEEIKFTPERAAIAVDMSLYDNNTTWTEVISLIGEGAFKDSVLADRVILTSMFLKYSRFVYVLRRDGRKLVRFDVVRVGDGTGFPLDRYTAANLASRFRGYQVDALKELDVY
jgi:hypothetical protein